MEITLESDSKALAKRSDIYPTLRKRALRVFQFNLISFHFENFLRRGTLEQKCWFSRALQLKYKYLIDKKIVKNLAKKKVTLNNLQL